MPDAIWTNFKNSYPTTTVRDGVEAFTNFINSSPYNITFEQFAGMSVTEISDLLVAFNGGTAKEINTNFARQLIDMANALQEECPSPELLDQLFINAIRESDRVGTLALLSTLKNDTPGASISASDLLSDDPGTRATEISAIVGTLPCSHPFIRSKGQALVEDAYDFLESQTTQHHVKIKLADGDTYFKNYRFEWYKLDGSDPVVFLSANTGAYGDMDVAFSTVTDMDREIATAKIRVYDDKDQPVGIAFEEPPFADSLDLSFPGGAEDLEDLIIEPNPVVDSQMINIDFLEDIGVTVDPPPPEYSPLLYFLIITHVQILKLSDIAKAGGIRNYTGCPGDLTGDDIETANKLDRYAVMEIISPDHAFNIYLAGLVVPINTPRKLISKTRSEFLVIAAGAGDDKVGDYNAAEIYQKALAFNTYLNNFIIEWRKKHD